MCGLCGAMATYLSSSLIFAVWAQLPLSNLFFIHFWGSTGAVGSGPSQKWVIYGTKSCIGSHIWRPADTSGSWSNRLLCTFLFSKKSLKIELFKIGMFKLKNIKILAFYIHAPVLKMPLSYLQVSKSNDKPFLNRLISIKGFQMRNENTNDCKVEKLQNVSHFFYFLDRFILQMACFISFA